MASRPGSQNEGVIPHSLQAKPHNSLVAGTPYLMILLVLSVAVRGTGKGVRVPGPVPAGSSWPGLTLSPECSGHSPCCIVHSPNDAMNTQHRELK